MDPLILTNIGLAKLASATPEDQLEIKHVAVGDGGGGYPPIDPTMTALVNEVWRGDSSAPIRDSASNRVLIFETIIPNNVGGFTIREVGLFDVDGDMIAIGQIDEIEKTDGSPGTTPVMLTLRVRLTLENASQTDLIIADSPIVDHQGTSNRDASDAHPIEAITGLRGELDAKANTADLGTAAYKDVVSGNDDTTSGRLITTEWRGLDLTKRWRLTTGLWSWYKFATVRGDLYTYHGGFFIDRVYFDSISARIEFSGNTAPGEVHVRSFVSGFSDIGYGDVAYHHLGDGTFDLYVHLAIQTHPIVEFIGSQNTLISTDPIPGVDTLPSDAVIVPRAIDWNSQSMAQTWQDMTASRALSTNYTNTTGRPITISVEMYPAQVDDAIAVTVRCDGEIAWRQSLPGRSSGAYPRTRMVASLVVPPGSTYRAENEGPDIIFIWRELR